MPELRKDPITGRWVIISTQRGKRPSEFQVEPAKRKNGFCPFCPGNESRTPPEVLSYREIGSLPNNTGWNLRVVPNKFPALQIEGNLDKTGEGLYDRMNGIGTHEVIIETPEHKTTFANLPLKNIEDVFLAFRDRTMDLIKDPRFKYILIFKNEGEQAGATLEHGHSQLIALPIVPRQVNEEIDGARHYYEYKERCIFCDIIRQEQETQHRIIAENDAFISLSPFAPRFPFESWILPKQHHACFERSQMSDFKSLAEIMKLVLQKIDRVLNVPPYNFMIHTCPIQNTIDEFFHWHIEIIPKLLKIAGFEWGSGFHINPTTPEEASKFLRETDG